MLQGLWRKEPILLSSISKYQKRVSRKRSCKSLDWNWNCRINKTSKGCLSSWGKMERWGMGRNSGLWDIERTLGRRSREKQGAMGESEGPPFNNEDFSISVKWKILLVKSTLLGLFYIFSLTFLCKTNLTLQEKKRFILGQEVLKEDGVRLLILLQVSKQEEAERPLHPLTPSLTISEWNHHHLPATSKTITDLYMAPRA